MGALTMGGEDCLSDGKDGTWHPDPTTRTPKALGTEAGDASLRPFVTCELASSLPLISWQRGQHASRKTSPGPARPAGPCLR